MPGEWPKEKAKKQKKKIKVKSRERAKNFKTSQAKEDNSGCQITEIYLILPLGQLCETNPGGQLYEKSLAKT